VEISSFLTNLWSVLLNFVTIFIAVAIALAFYHADEYERLHSKIDKLVDGNEAILSMLIENANKISELQSQIGGIEDND
jgi:hypothetical protein